MENDVTEITIRDAVIEAICDVYPVVEIWDEYDDDLVKRLCFAVKQPTNEVALPRAESFVTVWVANGDIHVLLSRMVRSFVHKLVVVYAAPDSFDRVIEFVKLEYDAFLESKQPWHIISEKRRAARSGAGTVHRTVG